MASFHHQLRTPLTSVVGYTELLLSGDVGALSAEQLLMLERVGTNGAKLLDVVEALLRVARESLETGVSMHVGDLVSELASVGSGFAGDAVRAAEAPRLSA